MKNTLSEEDVIAVIHHQGRWGFYAGEQDLWVMDWNEWHNAYLSRGYNAPPPNPADRFGILVVDESSAETFLNAIEANRLDEDWLRDQLRSFHPNIQWEAVAHLFPRLLIDFDTRTLYSINADGIQFDLYVPEGWQGREGEFYDQIPESHRYWIDRSTDYLNECRKNYRSSRSL